MLVNHPPRSLTNLFKPSCSRLRLSIGSPFGPRAAIAVLLRIGRQRRLMLCRPVLGIDLAPVLANPVLARVGETGVMKQAIDALLAVWVFPRFLDCP
jgi:hypothetical protein